MLRIRFLASSALVLAVAAGYAAPALAQTEIVARPNPDADRLAEQIRVLAANPRDLAALLEAGTLSARLGDTAAALAFFQRAESIDPSNPRIAAGRAMALVRLERPGEALSLFQTAEARGLSPRDYAADRGFAYDLLGQPGLAQRDYKLALSGGADDETLRRYALSLGISGDTDEAMRELDPLLRRSDRAAWRARAFILAMNGDVEGAERIAASMMPGNMGASLMPFFRRLAALGPADRAFAVHFGELSPTQARLADARLAPALPGYVPPARPVQLAAVTPAPTPVRQPEQKGRRGRRDREPAPAPAPTPAPAPVQTAAASPLPAPPQFVERPAPIVQPLPSTPEPTPAPAPVRVAGRSDEGARPASPEPEDVEEPVAETRAEPAPRPVAARPAPTPPGPARVGQEDAVLSAIVGNITIPAAELEAINKPPVDTSAPEPARAPEEKPAAPKPAPAKAKPEPAKADSTTTKGKANSTAAKGKDAKPDPKAKKPEPKKPDPAKTDPKRVWVQVAGGANEATLAKAWKAVVAKAPAAMKGKSGWSTPLRATNRVLAGPFKTAAEAQSFVNMLGKAGVSAFVFTSEAGQKVTKLAL